MDRYELRRQDYSLSADQAELQAGYAKFCRSRCPLESVRAAESTGFDKNLWERLCDTGAVDMALPESAGGDGAGLVELSLVAEELGRVLAPVPWIEHVVAARLLARLGSASVETDVVRGRRIVAVDPNPAPRPGPRLVSAGAAADEIIVPTGSDVLRLSFDTRPARVDNIGMLPMAWIDPARADASTVLASGPDATAAYRRALDEWRVLSAAALVGLLDETLRIAAEFATTRYTLGIPIGSLQAISHPLANIAIVVNAARNLTRRAAWFLEYEPDYQPELPAAAFVYLTGEAPAAATMAVQVQGGLGVAAESAASAYLVRARGWSLAGGDPALHAVEIVTGREAANCRA
ncbi:acyl-CoA dehydrogenase [Skermania piniformis]|uniref:Acyl-CoA dehydrogenase family protein n=1 Tax=Skermania pinensis TaxID=39122 RepID=A0ABX8S7F3_9ACTN|nr:acyl-CoA dehydrogenase [Skermania piniformis]QXQ12947.1 acyl-CoA dehydrogenase family protein [Skermania piniformis]